ncbi:MAG: PTS fructose-like transporter subunit IIB [Elainellaceae cyanobacterium]
MAPINQIVAVTACPTGIAHTVMAAEALKKTAASLGYPNMKVETQGSDGVKNSLSEQDIAEADLVIVAADIHVDSARFANKPVYTTSTSRAIRDTRVVLEEAIAKVNPNYQQQTELRVPVPETVPTVSSLEEDNAHKRLVAITACPTGIAHTFMAAEALRKAAVELGHEMKVETQGSVGAKNQLTDEEIAQADAVIIAADTHVDLSRFGGKRLYQTSTNQALSRGPAVVNEALALPEPTPETAAAGSGDYLQNVGQAKATRSAKRSGPYKHLLTGVSYMLPIIVAGGLIIALSFVFGLDPAEGSFGDVLMQIGGEAAFALIVPILSGFIAFSIADRPGLAPGLVGGLLASNLGTGFLGGIVSGFLAGYIAKFVRDKINLPQNFEGLKPILVIPLLATLAVGLLMVYVFGAPVRALTEGLTSFLENMGQGNAVILGLILGGMMAVDMGGPVNKVAYTFAVGLLASNIDQPMAAVMAAGMTPPLGLALATFIAKGRFTPDEQQAGKVASVLGICFITEGAIPFAAEDPIRVIPPCIAGSAITGGLSMLFGCASRAPHGGVFVLAIPNAITNPGLYIVAIAVGALVTGVLVAQLKRRAPLPGASAS